MPANLENSAAATGLEKVHFHSNLKKRSMPKSIQTAVQLHSFHMLASNAQNSPSHASTLCEPWPDFQAGFRKGRWIRYQTANISWIIEKAREFQKNIYFCFIDYAKHLTMWITTICGKFLEMGISDHLTCLLRNLYASQEATVRTGYGTTDWFQIETLLV